MKRRHIDPWLMSLATAAIMLPFNIGAAIFGFFLCAGIYLMIARPRRPLPVDPAYAVATLVPAIGAILLGFANGSLPGDWRWASYPAYYMAVLPMAAGLCLVRDPLRQFVLGARLGVAILTLWALVAVLQGHMRFGFGSNPANAAFALTFLAVVARLDVLSPPRLLAGPKAWFYLALIPVLATGTRAVLPVFVLAGVIDLVTFARNRTTRTRQQERYRRLTMLAFVATALLGAGVMAPFVHERVNVTIDEIRNLDADPDPQKGGMTIRLAQWRAAQQVIGGNFWLGIGGAETGNAIVGHSPPAIRAELAKYGFAHNALLDEWMQRGVFGVMLMIGFFAFTFRRIYHQGSAAIRINVVLMAVLTLCFGMLHYLLLVDRHVALYALYFLFMTCDAHRRRQQAPPSPGPQ